MNGPDHYIAAEQLLRLVDDESGDRADSVYLMQAQVHATLALAAVQMTGEMCTCGLYEQHERRCRAQHWKQALFSPTIGDMPIEELGLAIRPYNVLKREGIHTVDELCRRTKADLHDMRNMGFVAVDDVVARLAEHGRQLAEKPERH